MGKMTARRAPAWQHQRGQALVFSLITASIILLVMVSMYSMGQQSIAKIKLQNTADSAVYSAVLAEARDYNFSAYTNRAIIANQVAIAQVVGLTSWARGFDNIYTNSNAWVPEWQAALGGPMAETLWNAPVGVYSGLAHPFKAVMDTAGPGAVELVNLVISALSTTQTLYHYGTALTVAQTIGFTPQAVADALELGISSNEDVSNELLTLNDKYNIVHLNDPSANLTGPGTVAALAHLVQWYKFTESKDPNSSGRDGDNSDRMANVTVSSLDRFSGNRNTSGGTLPGGATEMMYLTPMVVDVSRFAPYQTGAALMYLWHRGGTELKNIGGVKKTWSAMDATGYFGLEIFWISIFGIPIPIPVPIPFLPMGSGAARAGDSSDLSAGNNFGTRNSDAYGGAYDNVNTAGSAYIQRSKGAGGSLGSGGLRSYFDVTKLDRDNLSGPALILEIEKDSGQIPTSNSVSGGQLALQNGNKSDHMRALSKAEIYFARPTALWPRSDGKTELGSLYSPYWQARLASNDKWEKYVSVRLHLSGISP
jgi:hypothetical protein